MGLQAFAFLLDFTDIPEPISALFRDVRAQPHHVARCIDLSDGYNVDARAQGNQTALALRRTIASNQAPLCWTRQPLRVGESPSALF